MTASVRGVSELVRQKGVGGELVSEGVGELMSQLGVHQ